MNQGHTFYEKPKYSQLVYDVLLSTNQILIDKKN